MARTVSTRGPAGRGPVPRPGSPAVVTDLLAAAQGCLAAAEQADTAGRRFALAHLGALRAAAAVLACRGRPGGSRRPRSAWELLAEVAPEFAEWATFFAAGAPKRARAEAGLDVVCSREADDLLRDSWNFLELVRAWLADEGVADQPMALRVG